MRYEKFIIHDTAFCMRLLYIANIRIPTEKAHGIQIMEMCSALARSGNDVTLLVPTRDNPSIRGVDPFVYYGLEKNFSIQFVQAPDPTWLMGILGGLYIKLQALLFIHCLRKFLAELKKDTGLLYTRDEHLLLFLLRYSNNVVWEGHTLPSKRRWYVPIWNRCSKIVVITKGLKDELVRLGVSQEKIMLAPDAVDLDKFHPKASVSDLRNVLGLPQDKKIIFYSGHLFEWKGAQVLADVASRLDDDCLIVFLGGMDSDIQAFQTANRHLKNVALLPHVPYAELPKYMACADVAVLPNKKGMEISELFTSPLKMFQYMASGVPIVASDLPSIREILNDSNAVLVEPNSPDALARGITKVLNDPDLAKRISAQALEDVKQYSWDKRAERILRSLQ